MADNTELNTGSGGDVLASDDIGGVKFPRVKVVIGADGVNDGDVSSANPIPVVDSLGATEAKQNDEIETLQAIDTNGGLTTDVAVTGDNEGSLSAKLRGLNKILSSVWDSINSRLKVDGSGVTQPVSAASLPLPSNAAVETGGNLAGAAASLAVIDDWDESDRCKVNPIVGQAGVQGNSGNVNALTQRVVLATDQPQLTNALLVAGAAAADAGVSGNPVPISFRSNNAEPTAVSADGEVVYPWANRKGALVVVESLKHLGLMGDPFTHTFKRVTATTAQTGTAIWTPASGKKIVITDYQIQVGGTTAGTLTIWFGGAADTTYSAGTDYPIFEGEFVPSATLKPGVVLSGRWLSPTADHVLRYTTVGDMTVTIIVHGYEV